MKMFTVTQKLQEKSLKSLKKNPRNLKVNYGKCLEGLITFTFVYFQKHLFLKHFSGPQEPYCKTIWLVVDDLIHVWQYYTKRENIFCCITVTGFVLPPKTLLNPAFLGLVKKSSKSN